MEIILNKYEVEDSLLSMLTDLSQTILTQDDNLSPETLILKPTQNQTSKTTLVLQSPHQLSITCKIMIGGLPYDFEDTMLTINRSKRPGSPPTPQTQMAYFIMLENHQKESQRIFEKINKFDPNLLNRYYFFETIDQIMAVLENIKNNDFRLSDFSASFDQIQAELGPQIEASVKRIMKVLNKRG